MVFLLGGDGVSDIEFWALKGLGPGFWGAGIQVLELRVWG